MGSELLSYFNGDELAANVWQGKYAQEGEETPDDMHRRMAREFARIEEKYKQTEYSQGLGYEEGKLGLSKYGTKRATLDEDKIYDVECVAIESYDRKKEQMGWQALEFYILG